MRIVREHYLRHDIASEASVLKDLAIERDTGLVYVVVEMALARKYLELFEAPYLKNLIFPQTLALEVCWIPFGLFSVVVLRVVLC